MSSSQYITVQSFLNSNSITTRNPDEPYLQALKSLSREVLHLWKQTDRVEKRKFFDIGDVLEITKARNIQVHISNYKVPSIPDTTTLLRDNKWLIRLNSNNQTALKYTLAHEIAHVLFYSNKADNSPKKPEWFRRKQSINEEIAANIFARWIIAPPFLKPRFMEKPLPEAIFALAEHNMMRTRDSALRLLDCYPTKTNSPLCLVSWIDDPTHNNRELRITKLLNYYFGTQDKSYISDFTKAFCDSELYEFLVNEFVYNNKTKIHNYTKYLRFIVDLDINSFISDLRNTLLNPVKMGWVLFSFNEGHYVNLKRCILRPRSAAYFSHFGNKKHSSTFEEVNLGTLSGTYLIECSTRIVRGKKETIQVIWKDKDDSGIPVDFNLSGPEKA